MKLLNYFLWMLFKRKKKENKHYLWTSMYIYSVHSVMLSP